MYQAQPALQLMHKRNRKVAQNVGYFYNFHVTAPSNHPLVENSPNLVTLPSNDSI
jgi:hypothetical protein